MTDDDVLAAVRDCLTTARDQAAGEQMTRPARAIIARARRRRLRQSLAAAAAAVIAAVAVPALVPGSHGASPARLAAWTVTSRPGGRITVTIRELRDPVGLQRQLRADGVPATVRFTGQTPAGACTTRCPPSRASGCRPGSSPRPAAPAATPRSPSIPPPSPPASGYGSPSARLPPRPHRTACAALRSRPPGPSFTPAVTVPPESRRRPFPGAALLAAAGEHRPAWPHAAGQAHPSPADRGRAAGPAPGRPAASPRLVVSRPLGPSSDGA